MLRLARAEQWAHGALRRDLQVIDVTATCEEAVERLRQLAENRKAKVHLSKNGPRTVCARIRKICNWSGSTCWKMRCVTARKGDRLRWRVERSGDGPAQIVFQDHGAGIAAADLPHVFERFYRGDPSRNRTTGGFGLGLAIAKALVEAYGGTITAESAPGKGTRMMVELPAESAN